LLEIKETVAADTRRRGDQVTSPYEVVFLFDLDNTLLENDRVQDDLRNHLEREFGG
jgi:hypothetical protein